MLWVVVYSLSISILFRFLIKDTMTYMTVCFGMGILGGILRAWAEGAFDNDEE